MQSTPKLYLKNLVLNNFATFKTQSILFDSSFNAIIGETGAGKSLIVDALQLLFGSRADKKLIRKNSDCTTVEAVFICNDEKIKSFFNDIDFPIITNENDFDEITIKRIIYRNGSAKSFLNFQVCNLSTLQTFAKRFVDLVGQFDNQKLLSTNYQMALLDNYVGRHDLNSQYSKLYNESILIEQQISKLKSEQTTRAEKIDYLQFQINEIEELNPTIEDEEDLLQTKLSLQNAEAKNSTISKILSVLTDSPESVSNKISFAAKTLNTHSDFFPDEYSQKLQEAMTLIDDVAFNCSKEFLEECDETSIQGKLEDVLNRLDKYQKIKRKFGTSTIEIQRRLHEFQQELKGLEAIDQNIESLERQLKIISDDSLKIAQDIHNLRVAFAQKLSGELTEAVSNLNMTGADLRMEINKRQTLDKNGISSINFLVETNPGEGHHKVQDIASGGELSRILLALRQILSSNDSVSVFLFDEIDTGIGGGTALSIGKALGKVSSSSQVIAITHLPQIAHFATKLIVVSKETEKERTFSFIKEVHGNERASEIKAMTPLN